MKLGVVFPQIEMPADPMIIRDYAQAVEGMGFDYLLAFDHVLGASPDRPGGLSGPYKHTDPFHEIFILFGYLAGITQSLELVTGVLVLPQRQTALVAKQAAQIDLLSGGRLRLGVGIGWNYVEYEALNKEFSTRGRRCAEQVLLMRELWTKELVTFHGKHHTVNAAGINPLPIQRPIPVWFGGYADVALRRIGRLGDGWMPARTSVEDAKPMLDKIYAAMDEAGRDRSEFGIDPWIGGASLPRRQWLPRAREWQATGATHMAIDTMNCGFDTIDQHLEMIRHFKEEVGEVQG